MKLLVLHEPGLAEEAHAAADAIEAAYPGLETKAPEARNPPEGAYDTWRGQLFGPDLLNRLGVPAPGVWIVRRDLYAPDMNFVFGLARPGDGAVVSVHRLPDLGMVRKEAVHEVGHVLGLAHCAGPCVMQFSNTLAEAQAKPATPCPACARQARASFVPG